MHVVKILEGVRISIPKSIAKAHNLKIGDHMIIEENGTGFSVSPAEIVRKKR